MSEDRAATQAHRIAHLSRRRHPASAAKVITTGLATSGFLGTVGLLAANGQAPSSAAPAAAPAAQAAADAPQIIVTDTVHRTVYVDEFGNPVTPPAAPDVVAAAASPAVERSDGALLHSTANTASPAVATSASPTVLDATIPTVPLDALAGSTVPVTTAVATRTTHPASNPVATNPAAPPPVEAQTPAPTTGTIAADPAATAAPAATDPPATTAARRS